MDRETKENLLLIAMAFIAVAVFFLLQGCSAVTSIEDPTARLNQYFLPIEETEEEWECETDQECYDQCRDRGYSHEACEIEA